MKKIALVLLFLLFAVSTVAFAYMASSVNTNDFDIQIGTPDNATATLQTDLLNKVLIPYNATITQSNEVTEYRVSLRVVYGESVEFTITDNLPQEYQITYSASTFLTNENYTLIIKLLEPVDATNQIFHLTINF